MERRATLDKFLVTALPQADTALAPGIGHTATYHTDATLNTGIPATKPTLLLPNGAPAYHPISVAAQILGLHPRTLRLWEAAGLLRPKLRGIQRLFSNDDLRRVLCIHRMIHDEGIGIASIIRLVALAPCWEIVRCPADVCAACSAFRRGGIPCWKQTRRACPKGPEQCQKCDVYLQGQEAACIPRRSRRKRDASASEGPKA
jgi:MerR family transcriptional regulator/heat shock protein HspR